MSAIDDVAIYTEGDMRIARNAVQILADEKRDLQRQLEFAQTIMARAVITAGGEVRIWNGDLISPPKITVERSQDAAQDELVIRARLAERDPDTGGA